MEFYAVAGYKDVYQSPLPDDGLAPIYQYPTDALMLVLCRINATLFQRSGHTLEAQIEILRTLFPYLEPQKRRSIARLILTWNKDSTIEREQTTPILFNEQSIVQLISLAFQHYRAAEGDFIVNEQQLQNDVFDAILITNELYYKGDHLDLTTYESLWHLQLLQQNYLRDPLVIFRVAPIKFLLFYRFVQEVMQEGHYLQEFCSHFQLSSFFDYISLFIRIFSGLFATNPNGEIRWHLEVSERDATMVEQFSLRPRDFTSGSTLGRTHAHLVPRPIYFIQDRYAAILDFNFLGFMLDTALPYHFYHFTALKKSPTFPTYSAFQSFLGKQFHEAFITTELFRALFADRNDQILEEGKLPGTPDLVVIQGEKEVYLLEVKSTKVHFNVLEQLDINAFKSWLSFNFLQSKGNGRKNKGVPQLSDFIQAWVHPGKHPHLLQTLAKKKVRVYPIILYTENTLDMAGINSLCNESFLKATETVAGHFKHLYPLTLINLNFFINYYSALKQDKTLLKTLIRDYHKRITAERKVYQKNPQNIYTFLRSHISFAQYIQERQKKLPKDVTVVPISMDLKLGEYGSL